MTTVFIAGSRNIKNLDIEVTSRINNIIEQKYDIVLGDAAGADTSIQSYLNEKSVKNITIYCSGEIPRNNLGNWPTSNVFSKAAPGSREFFTAKDIKMAEVADFGLMIWDTKSTGTLSNTIELLRRKKKTLVFVNKNKIFKTIIEVSHLEDLISCMSEHSKIKADEKIGLYKSINSLKHEQLKMF